ncbi:MAG: nitrogen fixation protein NifH [Chloroflexi bacterium]|nr:nitrogen fixation protein NifH [Chloroflexota bacterium]
MSHWKSVLEADPIDWLLSEDNPSVRYSTLVDILERPADDGEVRRAKRKVMETGVVPRILATQKADGYWESRGDFYVRTKYRGTVWQLIVLAELGADADDERIRKACDFILESSQDQRSGGFAYVSSRNGGGDHSRVLPCLTGNMVWSLIRLGRLEDRRVRQGIDWITEYQRFDDGIGEAPKGWPYDGRERCWGRHTCHMGVVKAMKALAGIPAERRSTSVQRTIEVGAEYMLKHHVFKRSHDLTQVSKGSWLQFGFPLMWNTDVLEILGLLTELGYNDRRMQEAVDLIVSKQDSQGRWKLESTFNGRFQVSIEQKGKPSKWITLNSLKVLKRVAGLHGNQTQERTSG